MSAPDRSRPRRSFAALAALGAAAFGVAYGVTAWLDRPPPGMVRIPPGEFVMGTAGDTPQRNEQPAHKVKLDGFYMDETEVTNAQFRAFVAAAKYVTTAEKPPDWDEMNKQLPPDTPKPADDQLVPGSLVFTPPAGAVALDEPGGVVAVGAGG